MKNELNELVERLMKSQDVECARPKKTAEALEECIARNYVHVKFKNTGTELGLQLERDKCKLNDADFKNSKGKVYLAGGLTLNYNRVRCIAEIDLATCEGKGRLEPIEEVEYELIMRKNQN